MSLRALTQVWQHSTAKGGDLLLLLALADFADDDGTCWPAVSTLAKKARMTPRNVRRNLRELESAGEIIVETNMGRSGSNRYRVVLGIERQQSLDLAGEEKPRQNVCSPAAVGECLLTPASGPADAGVTLIVREPSLEPKKSRDPIFEAAWQRCPHIVDGAFIEAWAEWEAFRRSKRKPISAYGAAKQLKKLSAVPLAAALAAFDDAIAGDWQSVHPKTSTAGPGKSRQASFA